MKRTDTDLKKKRNSLSRKAKGQPDIAKEGLDWWLPWCEVDQGNLIASRRLE